MRIKIEPVPRSEKLRFMIWLTSASKLREDRSVHLDMKLLRDAWQHDNRRIVIK